ncbi:MAG: hypothetical protein JW837_10475 [Sedimentisphaerales bacterium]|nr:hypothetical protein [Sedimentisphaerales bacterium]
MRFTALLRKELRECLPWLLLAMITFIAAGSVILRVEILNESFINHRFSRFSPGNTINYWELICYTPIRETGLWLFFLSVGLGLVIGVRQFWLPNFTGTWPFLLHRSVKRETILTSKLIAALLTLTISLGLTWIAIFWSACRQEAFKIPLSFRIFFEGWIFIIMGLVSYLGTALSGLSRAKWYTTKIFGIAFAAVIIITFSGFTLAGLVLIITFFVVILLSQIFHTFQVREF